VLPALQVTEVIADLYGMSVVGWYHSHPSFPALPSVIDIANQLQMQQQVRLRSISFLLVCDRSLATASASTMG
jgi:proteasome lid subunit RPN8/RPN11